MLRTNPRKMSGRRYARYLAHHARKNNVLIMLAVIFIAGVAAGTFMAQNAGGEATSAVFRIVNEFIENRRNTVILRNVIYTSLSSLAFVAVLFVCGFCAISQPAVVLLPFLRGIGFGFSSAALYMNYGVSAAGFLALLMVPDMLISTIAILLCCRESLRLSGSFLNMMRKNTKEEDYPVKIYIARYVAAVVLCVISAFLESVLYFAFANYLVLG
ncbi:MAG: hypothetical protein FWG94_10600 [Oscillospiraceae bacterium]|nr:hypothetical protein [Oscillospiraceae bacterium]